MSQDDQQDDQFDAQPADEQQQDAAAADQQAAEGQVAEDQVEGEEGEQQEEEQDRSKMSTGIFGWVISASVHAALITIMGLVYFAAQQQEEETPPVRVTQIEPPPKKEEKPKEQRDITPKVEINYESEKESDKVAPVTALDLPDDNTSREENSDNPLPKGREEAVADSEMGGQGAFMAIGAGGGASGMFGYRSGGGKKRAIGRGGGSKGSESAVDAALRWFKKHQSPNGMWEAVNYPANCTEDPKCEPGKDHPGGTVALTGYAVLCFLGAGYDHKTPNKFKATVKKGLEYLVSVQKPEGTLGERNYENAVATMALAEAFAMTGDPELKGPAQKGVDVILKRQNKSKKDDPYGGLGWNYVGPDARNDASVTGWNVMALKSAFAGNLNIGQGMEGAKKWLELAWKANNPNWAKLTPYDKSVFSYCWNTGADKHDGHQNMACVGMVCSVFLGHRSGDVMLETMGNWVMENQMPRGWPTNTYYMYYNTLGVFQLGGERWQKWNATVRDLLVGNQRKGEGCFDGSWDWQGGGFHGHDIGRVLSTAYCCLCLEVYYRYAQVNQKGGKAH